LGGVGLAAVAIAPVVGFIAGFIGTLLGIGGGAIMVPVLVLAGVPVKLAAPASLFAILGTSSGGLRRLLRRGLVDVRLAAFLETASGLGAVTGVAAVGRLGEHTLRVLLGLALLASGLLLATTRRELGRTVESYRRSLARLSIAWLVSYAAGFASATLGIGGGVFKVPVLVFIVGLGLREAVSTSKLMVGITAAVGVIGHLVNGRVYIPLALALLAGTYTGALLSTRLLLGLHVSRLRLIAVTYYIVMGSYIIVRSLL